VCYIIPMFKHTMRNYLKGKGINLHKAKSWTLKSKVNKNDIKIKSAINKAKEMFYTVRRDKTTVLFRGQFGMEDVKSYSDSKISFIVDSVANDLKLQSFVAKWVYSFRKGKYNGSWRKKKTMLKTKSKKDSLRSKIGHDIKHCLCSKCKGKRNTWSYGVIQEYIDDLARESNLRRINK